MTINGDGLSLRIGGGLFCLKEFGIGRVRLAEAERTVQLINRVPDDSENAIVVLAGGAARLA